MMLSAVFGVVEGGGGSRVAGLVFVHHLTRSMAEE